MKSKLSAFTLVEMLVVLVIIGTLMNLSYGTAYSSISSQQMVQSARGLIQDIRVARIQAMNLQKRPNETWVHGVGLDLRDLSSQGRYIVFQLLANPPGQSPRDFTPYPANPVFNFYTESSVVGSIQGSPSTGRMKPFAEKFPVVFQANRRNWTVSSTCDTGSAQQRIDFLLFQSLSGNVRLYQIRAGTNPVQYNELTNCQISTILIGSDVAEYKIIINHQESDDIYMESRSL